MSDVSATVRMYRLDELGDCFLLTFRAGESVSRMLVDCGSFRNTKASQQRLAEIVADLRRQCGGAPLDVVVGTHQHNDHLSGFVHCADAFREIGVNQVWLSWLDDPQDRTARRIGREHLNLVGALHSARGLLARNVTTERGMRAFEIVDDMLGFYGGKGTSGGPPELPAKAVETLRRLGRRRPRYLRPGEVLDVPGLPADAIRVYVLGPPRDQDLLYRKDPREGESYDHSLAAATRAASMFLDAARAHDGSPTSYEEQYPFGITHKVRRSQTGSPELRALRRHYRASGESWRRIDEDWLAEAESLALYMDSFTNNSSVVLAIELVASGRVLLFAADAQVGNWLSWEGIDWPGARPTTDDLLARTVLYKVGHHGSHNATLAPALEKMTHPDLVALIPVHKRDPNITKANGWKMPAKNLFARLRRRTSNRVLQMDGVHTAACDPTKEPARSAWRAAGIRPKITSRYVELTIEDA